MSQHRDLTTDSVTSDNKFVCQNIQPYYVIAGPHYNDSALRNRTTCRPPEKLSRVITQMSGGSPVGIGPARLLYWLGSFAFESLVFRNTFPTALLFSYLWLMAAPGGTTPTAAVFPIENIGQVVDSIRVFSATGVRTTVIVQVGGITDTLGGGPPTQAWLTIIVVG